MTPEEEYQEAIDNGSIKDLGRGDIRILDQACSYDERDEKLPEI